MNMGGESTAAWRQFLDDLDARGLKRPEFVIVDGAPGLEAALVPLWGNGLPIERCTVHKHHGGRQREFPPRSRHNRRVAVNSLVRKGYAPVSKTLGSSSFGQSGLRGLIRQFPRQDRQRSNVDPEEEDGNCVERVIGDGHSTKQIRKAGTKSR